MASVRLSFVFSLVVLITACGGGGGDDDDDTADAMPAAQCGDGTCNGSETCASCAADCGQCPASCGDGSCNAGETCMSCPGDCGTCPASCGNNMCEAGEHCGNCFDCGCTGETICTGTSCENAFGRIYTITVVEGTVSTTNPDTGEAWDALGGAPDPFVDIQLNDVSIGVTSTKNDTFMPMWNEFAEATIPAGSSLNFFVWDEDISEHEFMFGCGYESVPAEVLRIGVITCDFGADTLLVYIEPK